LSIKGDGSACPPETDVWLDIDSYDHTIVLRAKTKDGTVPVNNILKITKEGFFTKCSSVNPALGFALDSYGKIKFK
jgi:hypothetical protein